MAKRKQQCDCFEKIEKSLKESSGVDYSCDSSACGLNIETGNVTPYPFSLVFKADNPTDRKKHKAKKALPSFCCFCGTQLSAHRT